MIDVLIFALGLGVFVVIVWTINFWAALAIWTVYMLIKWGIFKYILKLRRMDIMSAVWAIPSPGNSSYIMTAIILKGRCSYASMEAVVNKLMACPNTSPMKDRMVEVLGEQYWQREERFSIQKHLEILNTGPIGSMQELLDTMADLSHRPIEPTKSPWHMFIVEQFEQHDSALIVQFHHAIADGIALLYFMSHSSDVEPHMLQRFTNRSWCLEALSHILAPIIVPYVGFAMGDIERPLKEIFIYGGSLAGVKRTGITEMFQVSRLKVVATRFKTTINILMLTMVLSCLRQYIWEEYRKDEKTIPICIPFNLHRTPQAGHHISCSNNIGSFFFDAPASTALENEEDFWEAIHTTKRITENMRKLLLPSALGVFLRVVSLFPHTLARALIFRRLNQQPIYITNIAGSKSPLVYSGLTARDIVSLAPGIGPNSVCICIWSYKGKLHVTCNADIHKLDKPHVLMNMLTNMINACLDKYSNDIEASTTSLTSS